MTQILAKLDRLDEAEALLVAARAFAESEASVQQRVYFFEAAAFLVTQNERFEEGRALWQKLETSAAEMKSPRTVATALNYQTLCEGNVGSFVQAAATAERWRAYVIDNGLFGEARQFLDLNLAYVYQNLGRYSDALAAIERAEVLKVAHLGGLHVRYASAFAVLGQFARVGQHLDAITAATPMTPGLRLTAMILRLRLAAIAGVRAPGRNRTSTPSWRRPSASPSTRPRRCHRCAGCSHAPSSWCRRWRRRRRAKPARRHRAKGLHGLRISAEVMLARALMREGDVQAALPRVRIALGLAASYQPDVVYHAEMARSRTRCSARTARTARLSCGTPSTGSSTRPPARCRPSFATASCIATRSTATCSRQRAGSELATACCAERQDSRCLRARCMRTNRFSSVMPSRRTPLRWSDRAARAAASRRAGRPAAQRCGPARATAIRAARPPRRAAAAGTGQRDSSSASQVSRLSWPGARAPGRRSCGAGSPPASCAAPSGRRSGAAGHHRLEHVVHQVLGQRRVLQAALRVAHEEGAMLGQVAPAEGDRRRAGGWAWRTGSWRASVVVVSVHATVASRTSREPHQTSQADNIDVRTRHNGATVRAWKPSWVQKSWLPKTRPTSAT